MKKDFSELIKKLQEIDCRVDLTSTETKREDAIKFCYAVLKTMKDFGYDSIYGIKEEQEAELAKTMKEIGCVPYAQASKHLVEPNESPVGDLLCRQDIAFPTSFFAQIIDYDYGNAIRGLEKTFGGDEYSWAAEWLRAQDVAQDKEKIKEDEGREM